MSGPVDIGPDVRARVPRDRVPPGAEHCEAEVFAFGGDDLALVVRELTALEFAEWQKDSEGSGAGAMHQQIDFVGRCLCGSTNLAPVGFAYAGRLPRTVMQRAAEAALRLNGLEASDDGGKKA